MDFESLTFGSAITHVGPASYITAVLEQQVQNLLSSAETQRALTQKLHQTIEVLERRIAALEMDRHGFVCS